MRLKWRKVWKEYLENVYDEQEFTGQEIKHEDKKDNRLIQGVLREEFDKTLRDLRLRKLQEFMKFKQNFGKKLVKEAQLTF